MISLKINKSNLIYHFRHAEIMRLKQQKHEQEGQA